MSSIKERCANSLLSIDEMIFSMHEEVFDSIFEQIPDLSVFRLICWNDEDFEREDIDLFSGDWDPIESERVRVLDTFTESGKNCGQRVILSDGSIFTNKKILSTTIEHTEAFRTIQRLLEPIAKSLRAFWGEGWQMLIFSTGERIRLPFVGT